MRLQAIHENGFPIAITDLPGDMQVVAQRIGLELTLELMDKCGGMKVHINKTLNKPAMIRYCRKHYDPEKSSASINMICADMGISYITVARWLDERG